MIAVGRSPAAASGSASAKTTERQWWGSVPVDPAVSDEQGRFLLLLPKDYQAVDVTVKASGFAGSLVELLKPCA